MPQPTGWPPTLSLFSETLSWVDSGDYEGGHYSFSNEEGLIIESTIVFDNIFPQNLFMNATRGSNNPNGLFLSLWWQGTSLSNTYTFIQPGYNPSYVSGGQVGGETITDIIPFVPGNEYHPLTGLFSGAVPPPTPPSPDAESEDNMTATKGFGEKYGFRHKYGFTTPNGFTKHVGF